MTAFARAALLVATAASAATTGFAPLGFDFSGPTNRMITPNGDGKNDTVTFRFSNPRDSSGTIRIYDLRGHHLIDISIDVGDTSKSWDGKVGGRVVDPGIYIYALTAENRTYSGALVVVR